jgi:hypothetical protein
MLTSKPRHGPMGWRHPAMALAFGRAAKRAGVARGHLGLVRAGKNLEQEAIAMLTVRPPSQQISPQRAQRRRQQPPFRRSRRRANPLGRAMRGTIELASWVRTLPHERPPPAGRSRRPGRLSRSFVFTNATGQELPPRKQRLAARTAIEKYVAIRSPEQRPCSCHRNGGP